MALVLRNTTLDFVTNLPPVKHAEPEELLSLRPLITDWYKAKQFTARQIVDILRNEQRLIVTERQLRGRFEKWHINDKNQRSKKRKAESITTELPNDNDAGCSLPPSNPIDHLYHTQLTDEALLTHTNDHTHVNEQDQRLLVWSRSSTPDYLFSRNLQKSLQDAASAGVYSHGLENATQALGNSHPGIPPQLGASENEVEAMLVIISVRNFYARYRESHSVLSFAGVERSPIIDLTNGLTHALDAVNKYSTKANWDRLQQACDYADLSLREKHPDALIFLLKFLLYIGSRHQDAATKHVCDFLAQLSARIHGPNHPVALLCAAAGSHSLSPGLCDTLFAMFQERPCFTSQLSHARDVRKIRTFYSHILIYQSRYADADCILKDLESARSNPCDKVGPLRTLAYSKRKQGEFGAAEKALTTAWNALQSHREARSERGALVQENLADVSEDRGCLRQCEDYLYRALHLYQSSVRPNMAAKRRIATRLSGILQKQGKTTESWRLWQVYPDVLT